MKSKSMFILAICLAFLAAFSSAGIGRMHESDSVATWFVPAASASTLPSNPTYYLFAKFPDPRHKSFFCGPQEALVGVKGQLENAVCLDTFTYSSLRSDLAVAKQRVMIDHADIQEILHEAQSASKDLANEDPTAKKYALFIKVMTRYADALCSADSAQPEVRVPNTGIYMDFALTPTCGVSGNPKAGSIVRLSVDFFDADQESRTYSVSGFAFSGSFLVSQTGTGKHDVTCSYRPNYCLQPRVSSQTVTVKDSPLRRQRTHSVARLWNEVLLDAISVDRVRPPVQARNLFHFGAMLHDIWALSHFSDKTYLVNMPLGGADCEIPGVPASDDSMQEAMSYAAYNLVKERFEQSPGYTVTMAESRKLMNELGYDPEYTGAATALHHNAAALGNAIAHCYIAYGLQDGSNELGSYANQYYTPKNQPIDPKSLGNPNLTDWDHWQPIALEVFIDQGGNPVVGGAADFLAAEWGNVAPFSLRKDQRTTFKRDGNSYQVYLDPGAPPTASGGTADAYKWNFLLTGVWSSHLDPNDGVTMDISPRALGNAAPLPTSFQGMKDFYSLTSGGVKTLGRSLNPITQASYAPQTVLRGDYTRAMAEYWADGPKSETPPGHWFSILNAVTDNPQFKKRLWGTGPELSELEWDVKAYFTLGGAMHDSAIAAWSAKGYYDGIRPVSVIRAMADHGQSTDPKLPSYDPLGMPLVPGYVELIKPGDKLAGRDGRRVGQVKMRAWKGPTFIPDPESDTAGVDWVLPGNWWPYQRPSFVTPPFGGYISGHSTYSRAAAEVLTALTGDAYFPGGLFEVPIHASRYLVFENGPSRDLTLQWATYVDAADACSLSRIWGGIHTPADDIAGRLVGKQVGQQAIAYAKHFFEK